MTQGIIIAAPASGTGKTTLTLGLIRAFVRRGLTVQPLKSGPDYIDPAFHKIAAGRPSYNVDGWSMSDDLLQTHLTYGHDADLAIAEGSMGLFDGGDPSVYSRSGASAEIAAMTGWPVVLIMDVSGQAQSAAAIAQGFLNHYPDVHVAGVILNKVSSPRHEKLITEAMEAHKIRVFGSLPKQADLALPSRHLGLVQAGELTDIEARIEHLADFIEEHVDLDQVHATAKKLKSVEFSPRLTPPPAMRIAIAQDEAFSFIYPHHVRAWREQGATLLPFSPLANEGPDESAEFAWLPGGYPELHGGRLAGAQNFRTTMRKFSASKPVHGECGGYMVLGNALIDKDGNSHEMLGLLDLVTSFEKRKLNLGYRRAELTSPLYDGLSQRLHGHEFHYSTILEHNDQPLAEVYNAAGDKINSCGSRRDHITGTYFHMISELD